MGAEPPAEFHKFNVFEEVVAVTFPALAQLLVDPIRLEHVLQVGEPLVGFDGPERGVVPREIGKLPASTPVVFVRAVPGDRPAEGCNARR